MGMVSDRPRPAQAQRHVRPAHGVARLTLFINSTPYNVRPIACDPAAALKAIRLRKADGTTYHIALTEDGPICDCPDFIFARDGIDPAGCKHVRALTVTGLLAAKGGVA
jgi:hypothetical protein